MKQHQTVKRLFQQIWDWSGVQFYVSHLFELSALSSFWLRSPLFLAQDINHYSSKTKILATSAQNFCNETEEIQTKLFWGFISASRKEKIKTKTKKTNKQGWGGGSMLYISFMMLKKSKYSDKLI